MGFYKKKKKPRSVDGVIQDVPASKPKAKRKRAPSYTASKQGSSEPPSAVPWDCVVLGVDTAANSGWSAWARGRYVASGEVRAEDRDQVDGVIERTLRYAEKLKLRVVLVLERPWGANQNAVAVLTALGGAQWAWKIAWKAAKQPKNRIVLMYPTEWIGPVLGREWVRAGRDARRAHEQAVAAAIKGSEAGPDESPAILIGQCGSYAASVGAALTSKRKKTDSND